MASGSREWPSRPDYLPAEHRSGQLSGLLSEAQSAILPATPPPLPAPRPGDVLMRALESAEPVLVPLRAPRPDLIAALARAPLGTAPAGCMRLLVLLAAPEPGAAEARRLLLGLLLLLPLLLLPAL